MNHKEYMDKVTANKEYLEAVDTVCMDCDYCSEEPCKDCPVRKTVDRIMGNKSED